MNLRKTYIRTSWRPSYVLLMSLMKILVLVDICYRLIQFSTINACFVCKVISSWHSTVHPYVWIRYLPNLMKTFLIRILELSSSVFWKKVSANIYLVFFYQNGRNYQILDRLTKQGTIFKCIASLQISYISERKSF